MEESSEESEEAPICVYDTVVVVAEDVKNQSIGGSGQFAREPEKGDIGVVLEIFSGDEKVYMTECINEDGFTLWICDFFQHEITLHEKWKGRGPSRAANILSGEEYLPN